VAEPFLHQVERNTGGDGGHPETVPQPFGRRRHTREPGGLHHRMHRPPAGHPRPRPEPHAAASAAPCVQFADAVHHVEGIEQGRGTGTLRKIPVRRFLRLSNGSVIRRAKIDWPDKALLAYGLPGWGNGKCGALSATRRRFPNDLSERPAVTGASDAAFVESNSMGAVVEFSTALSTRPTSSRWWSSGASDTN
jgi:hypothetical protein